MSHWIKILILTVATYLFLLSSISAAPLPINSPGHIHYIADKGGLWGIIGDDGKKYMPMNLPRKLRKEGLPVYFEAYEKNGPSNITWGTIIELKSIKPLPQRTFSEDESAAIYLLAKRMAAFNHRNLNELQQIDTSAKNYSTEKFTTWLDGYSNFRLRYVDISTASSTTITGVCFYTRDLINGMTLNGNIQIAPITFTLQLTTAGWKFTDVSSYSDGFAVSLDEILKKAQVKYGTEDLATLFPY